MECRLRRISTLYMTLYEPYNGFNGMFIQVLRLQSNHSFSIISQGCSPSGFRIIKLKETVHSRTHYITIKE